MLVFASEKQQSSSIQKGFSCQDRIFHIEQHPSPLTTALPTEPADSMRNPLLQFHLCHMQELKARIGAFSPPLRPNNSSCAREQKTTLNHSPSLCPLLLADKQPLKIHHKED